MITKATAARLWNCYREIEVGMKLLKDMESNLKNYPDRDPNPRDPFGQQRPLQLGIPMGDTSHRCMDVQPRLACSIIRAHVAEKTRELAEANEQARIELDLIDADYTKEEGETDS